MQGGWSAAQPTRLRNSEKTHCPACAGCKKSLRLIFALLANFHGVMRFFRVPNKVRGSDFKGGKIMKINLKMLQIPAFIIAVLLAGTGVAQERSFLGFGSTTLSFEYAVRLERCGKIINTTETQEFFRGDRLQFVFRSYQDCYAYIILKGSSGHYQMLFPNRIIEGGKNWIVEDREYVIPAQGTFTIDNQSGIEHLFFLFSPVKINEAEAFVNRGFVGANIVENVLLDLRNRQTDGYTLTREKKKDKCRITLKSPEKNPVLSFDLFIRHQ